MDLIKEALSMGFADAAIMDTKDLVFVPEYRQFCEDNLCGNYNLVPACPPACGTVEEMQAKALKYEKALVLQTVLKDPIMDPVLFKQAKHAQNILTEQLARQMQEAGKEDILIMSAGPYKNCSCMSAYSVDAQKMADAKGIHIALSNPCFEFWYLLHFQYTTKFFKDYPAVKNALTTYLPDYEKTGDVYSQLSAHTTNALQNAKRVEQYHLQNGSSKPFGIAVNPFTDIYQLVESLL